MALHKSVLVAISRQRFLSRLGLHARGKGTLRSSQALSALHPFYLSVHPDFFAQHPKIQKVNETSLKQLNSYLESLQCTQQIKTLRPLKVSFYFKKKSEGSSTDYGDFRLVNFTLHSLDLTTNIEHILTSCDLPANHLENLRQQEAWPRKVTYDASLEQRIRRTGYGFEWQRRENDEDVEQEIYSDIKLRQWLNKNAAGCRKQQEESHAIRQSNETLKANLCMELGLREIVWCSPWQYTSEQGVLRSFSRFSAQHLDSLRCLQGNRLVFTDKTMAAADHSVCLNLEDVPQQWSEFFSRYDDKLHQRYARAKSLDDFVSQFCGNVKILRPKVRMSRFRDYHLVSIGEYTSVLNEVYTQLKALDVKNSKLLPWSMRNLEMTFVKTHGSRDSSVFLFSNGRFCVDASCDPEFMLAYLGKSKILAEEKKFVYERDRTTAEKLASRCKDKLGAKSIIKDFDVEQYNMASCCEKLLRHSAIFATLLEGLDVRITEKYYATFDDGYVCIPWDWKI